MILGGISGQNLAARINFRLNDISSAFCSMIRSTYTSYSEEHLSSPRYSCSIEVPESTFATDSLSRNNINLLRTYVTYLKTGDDHSLKNFVKELAQHRISQGYGMTEIASALFLFRPAVSEVLGLETLSGVDQTACDLVTMCAVTTLASAVESIHRKTKRAPEKVYPPTEIFVMYDKNDIPKLRGGHFAELWTIPVGMAKINQPKTCPLLGATVHNRYYILKHLASGSYKHGWLALDLHQKTDDGFRKVFFATMRARHDGPCVEQDLELELDVNRTIIDKEIRHPHLAGVIDVTTKYSPRRIELKSGVTARIHYIVNEFCSGGELFGFISSGLSVLWPKNGETSVLGANFSEPSSRKMFKQLLSAVKYLHKNGFFHRDIKVDNVLVAKTNSGMWSLKLGDFGRLIEQERLPGDSGIPNNNLINTGGKEKEDQNVKQDEMNIEKNVKRTSCRPCNLVKQTFNAAASYCAPEMQKNAIYDGGPADIWQLGIILLHIVAISHTQGWQGTAGWRTAESPFEALEEQVETLLVQPNPRFFQPLRSFLSAPLIDLLSRIFSKDPRNRPSAEDILAHPWMTENIASDITLCTELELRKPSGPRNTHKLLLPTTWNMDHAMTNITSILKSMQGVQISAIERRGFLTVSYSKISMTLTIFSGEEELLLDTSQVLELHWTGGTDSSAWIRFIIDIRELIKSIGHRKVRQRSSSNKRQLSTS